MSGWRALSSAMWRGFLRDRTSQFFYFLFPLMFLVIFGLLFSNPNLGRTDLGVVGDGPVIAALPDSVVNLKPYDSFDEAIDHVAAGRVPAVVRQVDDVVELRYSAVDQVASGTVQGILSAVIGEANQQISGVPPEFTLDARQVEDESFEPMQFLTAGILSWGVATSAALGAALNLVAWRRSRVLRRIRLAPVSTLSVVGARIGVSVLIALLQTVTFIGIAMTPPFGVQLTSGSWFILPLVLSGTIAFMAVGVLVGSLVKTEEAASGAVNIIILPMAFLSGVFLEPGILPDWLERITWAMPMKHMSSGILDVLVRGDRLASATGHLAALIGFAAVLSVVAARAFDWDDA